MQNCFDFCDRQIESLSDFFYEEIYGMEDNKKSNETSVDAELREIEKNNHKRKVKKIVFFVIILLL